MKQPMPQAQQDALLQDAETLSAAVAAHAAAHDREASLPREGIDALVASPLHTMLLDGASWLTFGQAVRILARSDASLATLWIMHQGCGMTFLALPDPDLVASFMSELRAGAWVGNALSEPTSGNLFLMPQQVAERTDGGWRLTGTKRFVSGCEHARYLLTNALCDGAPGFFLIDKDDSIRIEQVWDTLGMRATRSQLLHFDDTLLPESRRIPIDPNVPRPNGIMVGLPWMSIGIAEAAMDAAIEYARSRTLPPAGAPLAHLQWVQFAVADMSTRLEAARALATVAAQTADRQDPRFGPLLMQAKIVANEAAIWIASRALEIFGGSGYFRTRPVERYLRDALSGPLMAFSSAVIRDFLGKSLLGLGPDHG